MIKILDLKKSDSYTQRGRYVVCIDGERQYSGDTEQEALEKTVTMLFRLNQEYKNELNTIKEKLKPLQEYLWPAEYDDGYGE